MTPREIIAEAWTITLREKSLRRWGIFNSLLETLLTTKLVIYQVWFLISYLRGKPAGFFDDVIWLHQNVSTVALVSIVGGFCFLLVLEWILPNLARGAIIGLAAKAYKKEPVKGGLVLAIYNFFPLFAVHEFFFLAGFTTVLTIISLILRYVMTDLKFFMIVFIVLFWFLSNILKFLSSFAEPAIVIHRVSIFEAMGRSFRLILSYLSHVMFLWLLLFVISIRIAFNAALVLVIPGIAFGIGFLLALFSSPVIAYSIATGVGLILILIASYFFAYLHVFKEAVWTITYFELKKFKDLVIIEDEDEDKEKEEEKAESSGLPGAATA
ncbi:MAG: hypothetical protein WCS85_04635 [Candidatus Peribacteraceae bacterium]